MAGVVDRNGAPALDGVETEDELVRVGELEVEGSTMGQVVAALRGRPGEKRALELERNGRRFNVEAKVMSLP